MEHNGKQHSEHEPHAFKPAAPVAAPQPHDAHAARPAHLHHHFETEQQQYDSDKLGMWLFLVTEIILFGGLFVAYAYYRANHPEIFIYAHKYLDKTLGGINTVVLIFSSLTMAWAVRAAQLGQRKLLIALLAITLLCGFGFLSIKAVEYEHKWKHGLRWGVNFNPVGLEHGEEAVEATDSAALPATGAVPADITPAASDTVTPAADNAASPQPTATAPAAGAEPPAAGFAIEHSNLEPPGAPPAGLSHLPDAPAPKVEHVLDKPEKVQLFFGIYFVMTGLHGLHVIIGMIVITIMLVLAIKGRFGPEYFTPVDLTGLYWHIVDVIWIFLFPLLYLIH